MNVGGGERQGGERRTIHACMSRQFITSKEAYNVTKRNLEKTNIIFTNCFPQASVSNIALLTSGHVQCALL